MLVSVLVWLAIGGVAGLVVGSLVYRRHHKSIQNVVLGAAGAIIGGFLLEALGPPDVTGFDAWSLLTAFVGAVACLSFWHRTFDRRSGRAGRDVRHAAAAAAAPGRPRP